MVAPQRRAGTGIPGLDAAIDGLRIGDNVVWHCDTLADFSRVLAPFLAAARAEGRHLVYVRFATHPSLVSGEDVHVHELDPRAGFEPFTLAVHALRRRRTAARRLIEPRPPRPSFDRRRVIRGLFGPRQSPIS